jgi:hypothetical protein
MEKELVPYAEALALKELGFDEPCFGWWFVDEKMLIIEKSKKSISETIIQAPTYSQAFRWFRKKHSLYHRLVSESWETNYEFDTPDIEWDPTKPCWTKYNINGDFSKDKYESDEEVELACLHKLIEIVKGK